MKITITEAELDKLARHESEVMHMQALERAARAEIALAQHGAADAEKRRTAVYNALTAKYGTFQGQISATGEAVVIPHPAPPAPGDLLADMPAEPAK